MSPEEIRRFIIANTAPARPPHAPEIMLHLADEAHDLWHRTQEELQEIGLPPPFWAFAWAGGQALARHVLDHPQITVGKRILDLATGSGLVAIAALRAGAAVVTANDIDEFAVEAAGLNAALNNMEITRILGGSLLDKPAGPEQYDVILAGDIFYDRQLAGEALPWLQSACEQGCRILIGDPGRAYLPKTGLSMLAEYEVPVTRELEDSEVKRTRVWELQPPA